MTRKFLGSLGLLFEIFKKVVAAVHDLGGNDKDIEQINHNNEIAKNIAAVICGTAKVLPLASDELKGQQATFQLIASLAGIKVSSDSVTRPRGLWLTMCEALDVATKSLSHREWEILKLRYGIGDGYTYTLEDVGRIFKVTPERIRQIEAKVVRKLHHPVRLKLIADYLKDSDYKEAKELRASLLTIVKAEAEPTFSTEQNELLSKSVTELGNFSIRTRKTLGKLNIQTISDLINHSANELLSVKSSGVSVIMEVRGALQKHNLKLKND